MPQQQRVRHRTIPVMYAWNAAERLAQADRVIMRATKQQERRKVATAGTPRRRKGER